MKFYRIVAAALVFSAAAAFGQVPADKSAPNLPADEDVEEPPAQENAAPPKHATPAPPPALTFGERPRTDGVVLQALDKITAHVTSLTAALNEPVRFGSLVITARACNMRPPEEEPESAAFLQIDDISKNGQRTRVFSGWMFASSPALSALEHPVYDVWVKSCKIASGPAAHAPSSRR